MKKRNRLIPLCMVTLMATMLFSTTALAASKSTTAQMAANSAAWHVANAAGDTATCNKLHEANKQLASQAAGSGGSSSYNSSSGTWSITDSKGNTTKSSGSSNNKTNTSTYTTTSSSGRTTSNSSSSYSKDSINAYKNNGGTNSGLTTAYNNDANKTSASGEYGDNNAVTTSKSEAAVVQELLGLSDYQTKKLQSDLENAKEEYDKAQDDYNTAVKNGDTSAAEAAQKAMDDAHSDAEKTRSQYNYSGDSTDYDDGGYYDGTGKKPSSGGGGFYVTSVTQTFDITATTGSGGTITPAGTQKVTKGADKTFTITPNQGFKIDKVLVDGTDKGAITTYTFDNVTAHHTISATFVPTGKVGISDVIVTDLEGNNLANTSIKSGYGIFVSLNATETDVTDVVVTAKYNFGNGNKTTTLVEVGSNYQFAENSASPNDYRCVYIPVDAKDKDYTITFTITGTNAADETVTATKTATIEVLGSMYEDDFTSDGY